MPNSFQNNFQELVAVFLSEIIRSRKTPIKRAAEISSRVVSMIGQFQNEVQVLDFLTDTEKEFNEVTTLKQALHFGYSDTDVKVYEKEIKEFAAEIFKDDMAGSAAFLHEASTPGITIQQLCIKYPNFCNYLIKCSDKSMILRELSLA